MWLTFTVNPIQDGHHNWPYRRDKNDNNTVSSKDTILAYSVFEAECHS